MKARPPTDVLPVAGLTRLTSIDYPGELAAVVFLQGCPWRCGYCHNSELQSRDVPADAPRWSSVLSWLQTRRGLLDAVVFSGGEPTLHRGLEDALRQVRAMGYKTGLHTAGIYPRKLRALLPLLDWVGLDIKAPYAQYDRLSGVKDSARRARKSIRALLESGVEYEIRTTVHPDQLNERQLQTLGEELQAYGVDNLVIQHCVLQGCADKALHSLQRPRPTPDFLRQLGRGFARFVVRDAA